MPGAQAYQAHARATLEQRSVCVVLSPSREIKVFAEGAEVFAFHGAAWHLLDLKAKFEIWTEAVGNPLLALRLFQTALDLADAREGALFVVLRDPADSVLPARRVRRIASDVCDRTEMPGSGSVVSRPRDPAPARGTNARHRSRIPACSSRSRRSTARLWSTPAGGC